MFGYAKEELRKSFENLQNKMQEVQKEEDGYQRKIHHIELYKKQKTQYRKVKMCILILTIMSGTWTLGAILGSAPILLAVTPYFVLGFSAWSVRRCKKDLKANYSELLALSDLEVSKQLFSLEGEKHKCLVEQEYLNQQITKCLSEYSKLVQLAQYQDDLEDYSKSIYYQADSKDEYEQLLFNLENSDEHDSVEEVSSIELGYQFKKDFKNRCE